MKKLKARIFFENYWLDNGTPSKAVTSILGWMCEGKLTPEGKKHYRLLVMNLK